MNNKPLIKLSDQILSQKVSNEAVLLDLQNESYFGLDEVGARIWALLQEYGDRQHILTILLEEYAVDEATLSDDLEGFIQQLHAAGLIVFVDDK